MPLETHDDILDPSKSPEDHYGPAIAALEKLVSEIMAEPSYRVACHAWYSPAHGIRVAELSIVVDAQGSGMSWMRSVPDNMDIQGPAHWREPLLSKRRRARSTATKSDR